MDDERRQVQPDWSLIDEVSIPLLDSGVGAFEVLQSCLPSVVLCKASANHKEWTQERLLKMFRIAQLQIQHVLKSQHELSKTVSSLEETRTHLLRENKQLRQILKNSPDLSSEYFKCEHCGKLFISITFLREHIERRHPKHLDPKAEVTLPLTAQVDSSVATSVWVSHC
uniref:C2H2-type domain-containing protein n=1 Tax=Steinernema glaseri TaxID=37863 RepID=A0A1I7YM71_9BILA